MARRKRGFDLVRDDLDEEPREPAVRRNRSEFKRDLARKEALALTMVALPPSALARLPIEEHIRDAVTNLAACAPTPARRRQLLRVVGFLRDVDLDALDAALAGDTPHEAYLRSLERWRTRIVEGDDAQIHAFAEVHPGAEIQSLRQVARVARTEGPKAAKARKRLFELLKKAGPAVVSDDAMPEGDGAFAEE